jgi:hypothetical protein
VKLSTGMRSMGLDWEGSISRWRWPSRSGCPERGLWMSPAASYFLRADSERLPRSHGYRRRRGQRRRAGFSSPPIEAV